MDIIGSLCALAVLAVPMLVIALLIFLQDFHNPFFRQVRVTKDGRYFYMYSSAPCVWMPNRSWMR